MKTLILTENQIRRVIDNIINEQSTNNSVFTVNFQNAFGSGQYNFTPEYEKIVNDAVEKIDQFIKNKKITNFKLVISSGESQVPNPEGFSEKGSLARKRAEVLSGYLNVVLPKILGFKPTIEIAEPVIGQTKWTSNSNKNDVNYTREQFVNVNVVLNVDTPKIPSPENPNKGFVINVRGDEPGNRGAFYFPKTLNDWKMITKDPRMEGFFSSAEQRGSHYAGTTVNMDHNVFLKYWLSKAPDLESLLGPPYIRDPKNSDNFILKQ